MSLFSEAMAQGNEALVHATGDSLAYWPGGVEAHARDMEIIFTALGRQDEERARGMTEVARAEVQIPANDVDGVATPQLKLDLVMRGGEAWCVMEVLETVGGMHRLLCELSGRSVVGHGRGMR